MNESLAEPVPWYWVPGRGILRHYSIKLQGLQKIYCWFFANLEKTCEINWIWTPLGGIWKVLNHLSPGGIPLGDKWKA